MEPLWKIARGDAPVIVNVPHAGIFIPASLRSSLTGDALAVPDTDWHVDRLYDAIAPALNVTLMSATHSRIVVDLNRHPAGDPLYPGAANTEICPLATFHDRPVYRAGHEPGAKETAARVALYWQPYHAQLAREIARVQARHGSCIVLDGHSIVSHAPRFFAGRLPDLNLGTADGASCDPRLADAAFAVLSGARGFTSVHNGRFKGGYITRHYGQPAIGVHALQLEMAQSCYLDESQPAEYRMDLAAPLIEVLRSLLQSLLATLGNATRK